MAAGTYRDPERGGPPVIQHGAVLGMLQLIVDGERHRLHVIRRVLGHTERVGGEPGAGPAPRGVPQTSQVCPAAPTQSGM